MVLARLWALLALFMFGCGTAAGALNQPFVSFIPCLLAWMPLEAALGAARRDALGRGAK